LMKDARTRTKSIMASDAAEHAERVDALVGKYAHVPFSTEDLFRERQEDREFSVCDASGGSMPTVTLELPQEVFSALRRSPEEFVRELRLAAAIHWYERSEISQEKAAQIAGLDRTDFLLALAREGADAFVVDMADLKRELDRA